MTISRPKATVFVARPLSDQGRLKANFFQRVEDTLVRPAVERAAEEMGYDFEVLVGSSLSSREMLENILMRIERAKICIFDITQLNPNVLMEYGYRGAILSAPIVVISCEDVTPKPPFDLSHHKVCFYRKTDIADTTPRAKIRELTNFIIEEISSQAIKPSLVTTDDIYAVYGQLTLKEDLMICVATWPAFPTLWHEYALMNSAAKFITVLGPVDNISQLPGIFWRLHIREERSKRNMGPLFIYGKHLPAVKMIIAGDKTFRSSCRSDQKNHLIL